MRVSSLSAIWLGLIGVCLVALPQPASGQDQEAEYVIKLATVAPKGSAWMEILEDFNEELKQETNGKVAFRFYPGGVAGDEPEVQRKILYGQLQAGGFAGAGLGHIVSECRILEVPFLFKDYGEYEAVRDHINDRIVQRFEEEGFIFLGWAEAGFTYFYSKKKIERQSDLAAAKPWVWTQDEVGKKFYEVMEVQAIPVGVPDVLTSLKTGYIETVYASPIVMVAFQWFEGVRYVTRMPMNPIPASVLIQKEFFDTLPPEYQEVLRRLGAKYIGRIVVRARADDEESKQVLAEEGIQWVEPSKVAEREFQKSGLQCAKALVGELYDKDFLIEVVRTLGQYRKEQAAAKKSE